jgi:hypothetical protein
MTFLRPSYALLTALPTPFLRASYAHLFLATGFLLPVRPDPIPLSARALPFGRTARRTPSKAKGTSQTGAANGSRTRVPYN